MKLLGSPRTFPDLPHLWDGVPVRWEKWEKRLTSSLDIHMGHPLCEGCQIGSSLWEARGWWRRPGDLTRWDLLDLHATRCGWCGHTTVFTMHDEQAWTLDETDYGEHGSYDIEKQQTLF